MADFGNTSTSRMPPGKMNGARAGGFAVVLLLLALFAVVAARAWNTKRILTLAAREAARIAVSTPLNAGNCTDRTPCSVESAAATAKQYLTNAGFAQASCVTPQHPSFSGVLVWTYSCGATQGNDCDSSTHAICLKIDMTAFIDGPNHAWVPSTRVTVRDPYWIRGLVLSGEATVPFPAKTLEGIAPAQK